jgi:DNA-binding CsgD family transcriptional regulator
MRRPGVSCLEGLTIAELDVLSRLVEGWSQWEIASSRNARPRTVVNQMASARRKLRIGGRIELVRFLATHQGP